MSKQKINVNEIEYEIVEGEFDLISSYWYSMPINYNNNYPLFGDYE